jgi:hypothetical protein
MPPEMVAKVVPLGTRVSSGPRVDQRKVSVGEMSARLNAWTIAPSAGFAPPTTRRQARKLPRAKGVTRRAAGASIR